MLIILYQHSLCEHGHQGFSTRTLEILTLSQWYTLSGMKTLDLENPNAVPLLQSLIKITFLGFKKHTSKLHLGLIESWIDHTFLFFLTRPHIYLITIKLPLFWWRQNGIASYALYNVLLWQIIYMTYFVFSFAHFQLILSDSS